MEADGSGQTNLTSTSISEGNAKWSADGTRIAFRTGDEPRLPDLHDAGRWFRSAAGDRWVIRPLPVLVTRRRASGLHQDYDGSTQDLYTVNADGTGLQRLTTGLFAYDPAWSPDGSRIAYAASSLGSPRDLFSIDPAGGVPQQLTHTSSDEAVPAWSPDSRFLVFLKATAGRWRRSVATVAIGVRRRPSSRSDFEAPVVAPTATASRYEQRRDCDDQPNRFRRKSPCRRPGEAPTGRPSNLPHHPIPAIRVQRARRHYSCTWCPRMSPALSPTGAWSDPRLRLMRAGNTDFAVPDGGTADSNGHATRFIGSVRLDTIVGNPSTPRTRPMSASRSISPTCCVRWTCPAAPARERSRTTPGNCKGVSQRGSPTGSPVTPRTNPARSETCSSSRSPIFLRGDPDPGTGGACALITSFDALVPGLIKERKRTIWQVGQIEVRDGGEDGAASSDDNTMFARQGCSSVIAMRVLFCGVCLAIALVPASPATATFPGTNGKIAFWVTPARTSTPSTPTGRTRRT